MNEQTFYFEFENKHRGSRNLILERLKFYEPLIRFISQENRDGKPKALDLGCGRGEFLELLSLHNFEAEGVDINEENVKLAQNLGLTAHKGDILEHLRKTPDKTYHLVTMIHVIEHLPFNYIFELFTEVSRVLKDKGFFIVEFPNIKSPLIGAYNFWLDPTHIRPIHPELLQFLGEKNGLKILKIFPLHGIKNTESINIESLFYSSPDVSMIFAKQTEELLYLEKLRDILNELTMHASLDFEYVAALFNRDLMTQKNQIIQLLNKQLRLQEQLTEIKSQNIEMKSRLDALWYSKPWRFYLWLGEKKRRLLTAIDLTSLKAFIKRSPAIRKALNKLFKKKSIPERLNFTTSNNLTNQFKKSKLFNYEIQIIKERLMLWKK